MTMIMTNPTGRQLLRDRQMAIMDYNTEIISAEKKGQARGEEIGQIRGEKIGQIRGEEMAARKLAKAFVQEGIDPLVIARATGLTLEDIANL